MFHLRLTVVLIKKLIFDKPECTTAQIEFNSTTMYGCAIINLETENSPKSRLRINYEILCR